MRPPDEGAMIDPAGVLFGFPAVAIEQARLALR